MFFIDSFKKTVKKNIPPKTIVINGEALGKSFIGLPITIHDELRNAYINDCISTLTFEQYKQSNINSIKEKYIEFATQSFDYDLRKNEDKNNGNVDMYDFSMSLLDFDKLVVKTNGANTNATNSAFVSLGLSWLSSGLGQIFDHSDSSVYSLAKFYSKTPSMSEQTQYDAEIQSNFLDNSKNKYYQSIDKNKDGKASFGEAIYNLNALSTANLLGSPHFISLVANKVWFFNEQLRTIFNLYLADKNHLIANLPANTTSIFVDFSKTSKYLESIASGQMFINGNTVNNNTINFYSTKKMLSAGVSITSDISLKNPLKPSDLKTPNYMMSFDILEAGIIFLIALFPIVAIINIIVFFRIMPDYRYKLLMIRGKILKKFKKNKDEVEYND